MVEKLGFNTPLMKHV